MNKKTADLICLMSVVALGAFMIAWYPGLPDPMPSHWNMKGEVDGYIARDPGVALLFGLPVFCWVLMKIIPRISPKGFRTDEFSEVLNILQVALVVFMSGIGVAVLVESREGGLDMTNYVLVATGGLLIVIGNYLGKVRKNFFIGIRTPWTLASDEVWSKTHRLGGWCLVFAGVVILLSGVFGVNENVMAFIIVPTVIAPVLYSYLLYRKIEGFSEDADDPTAH